MSIVSTAGHRQAHVQQILAMPVSNRSISMSEEVVVSNDSDNAVDAIAAVALVAIFVATCIFWVASH